MPWFLHGRLTIYCSFPHNGQESLTEVEMQKLEAAREAYIAAVAEAKEKQDDESIAAAVKARFHLQSVVLK